MEVHRLAQQSFDDTPGRELLYAVCAALDIAEDCMQPRSSSTRASPWEQGWHGRDNQRFAQALAHRSFIVRTLARLGLDYEPVKAVGRPT